MPVAECLTRRGLDWTHQYPAIHAAVLVLGIREAYLDGGQKQPPRSVRANEFSSTAFSFCRWQRTYLVSLAAVGAATVGVFFGVGFLLLAPPHPTAPSADPDPLAQALESLDLPTPAINDTAPGSSSAPAAKYVAASPTFGAPSNRDGPELVATAIDTALIPPGRITHAKKSRAGRLAHQGTGRRSAALWRPEEQIGPGQAGSFEHRSSYDIRAVATPARNRASAGPNPGGGFYGPPNINVGYINPK
jgi:hypothetical protein